MDVVRELLERNQVDPAHPGRGQSGHNGTFHRRPPAKRRGNRSTVHRSPRRVLLLVRLVRQLLQAENSTYKIAVGRATQVQGPYTDKANTAMTSGGGTILLRGSERNPSDNIPWAAVGHNAVLVSGNEAFNVYHAYAEAPSDPDFSLRIAELVWDRDGWPISGGP